MPAGGSHGNAFGHVVSAPHALLRSSARRPQRGKGNPQDAIDAQLIGVGVGGSIGAWPLHSVPLANRHRRIPCVSKGIEVGSKRRCGPLPLHSCPSR
eukprot:11613206-Alexandrium_andersonii.AAC.1